jgi:hypothetical protein
MVTIIWAHVAYEIGCLQPLGSCMGMGVGMVVYVDLGMMVEVWGRRGSSGGVNSGGGGGDGSVMVTAMVTQLPALPLHMCQWYV